MFDSVSFIGRVRELVSIPEEDELSPDQIIDRANEVFLTKFIQDKWRVLLRRKATFPITRFSTDISGFLLLNDTVKVYDSVQQKEDFYTVRFSSSRSLGSGFSSSSLNLEATTGILETDVHPLFMKVAYGSTEDQQNGIYFDNTSFSFSTLQENPVLSYEEATSSVSVVENGTIGNTLTVSGFTSNSYSTEVIYEAGKMIFPSDMRLLYEAPSVEVNGIFQPFTNGNLESFFTEPLFFERLYLITAKEILFFFTQAQEDTLMQRIEMQLDQNARQLAAMARSVLQKEQQQYHHRSVSSKFWQQYGLSSYNGGPGNW